MQYINSAEDIHFSTCHNPDCPNGGLFVATRSDQNHCDRKCRNRANFLKRRELMQTRYADTARLIAVEKKLERLHREQPDGYLYSEDMLRLLEIPINSAVEILYNTHNGRMVHMFFNYGIEYAEQGKYRIIKK